MKTDVVIVGGGPGGATCSMFLAREGLRSVIVEKERFPRYHIGESMTAEAGRVLRELGLEGEMLERGYPIKHGVKVFGTAGKTAWFLPVMARDENWNLRENFTWQVRRSDFDAMLLTEAIGRGAELVNGRATRPLLTDDGAVRGVQVRMRDGGTIDIEADLLLDCSGQATWLANLGGVTGPKFLGAYDKQIAIFSQVSNFVRDNGPGRDEQPGNTLILYRQKYHWAWVIPIDNEVVSVGIVVPSAYFLGKHESKRDFLLREMKELNPVLAQKLPDEIKLVEDVHIIPNYSFQVQNFCGRGFMCIGDAHRFVDPIFSFGMFLSMTEAGFAAKAAKAYIEGANRDAANPFAAHQLRVEQGIDVLEDMIDTFWEHSLPFATFAHHRYRDDLIDLFAGRIFERQPSVGTVAFRKLLHRERTYDSDGRYSVPIGSRYRPEDAPVWSPKSEVESTEAWMGPR